MPEQIDHEWMEMGALDDIPPLGSRVVQIPDGEIALFRTSDDQVFALLNRCPHKQGPLSDGMVHGHRVTCPLHDSGYTGFLAKTASSLTRLQHAVRCPHGTPDL